MSHPHTERFAENKQRVIEGLRRAAACPAGETAGVLADVYAPTAQCFVSHPVNELSGRESIAENFLDDLKKSFPDLQRAETIVMAGESGAQDMVTAAGHYIGTFENDWHGIPANHRVTQIRFGEAHRVEDGMITQSWVLIDFLDMMRQAGVWLLPPSLGAEGLWLPPADGSGVDLSTVDVERGQTTLTEVRAMQEALMRFDGVNLESMQQESYWSPHFNWYGPCGIGTTRQLSGFQAHHQIPFLIAFPDRKGGQHFVRMGEGAYAVTGGGPSVTATHTGDGWLGMPATGKSVRMRVMDFYRVENGLIVENWVPLDVIDLLLQMGYDMFDRLAHLRGQPRRSLPWKDE